MNVTLSWGRKYRFLHDVLCPAEREDINFPEKEKTTYLPFGMGRSYGDSNLNEGGTLIKTHRLKKFIKADWKKGIIRVEAGLTLDELLQVCVPKGWFLPVSPGSKYVTLGGAVANNVHGKNHHKVGSIGNFITKFAIHRSDNTHNPIVCSRKNNRELFTLTLGGLGLTGIIEWVELRLKPISSAYLYVENIPYKSLSEFFSLSEESKDWDYTVAWLDCFSKGKCLGRGIFSRARFESDGALRAHNPTPRFNWPFVTPAFFLNKMSIKSFNFLYRIRPGAKYCGMTHYDPFFYPLDGISNWNRLYGRKGFFQHQSIIPPELADTGIVEMLKTIEAAGQGSFLAVLKVHGLENSGGALSFCRDGVSLALDFPNKGKKTEKLLHNLDSIVVKNKGRIYPAKDGHMNAGIFQSIYPDWRVMEQKKDPALSSSFWRRVTSENRETKEIQ